MTDNKQPGVIFLERTKFDIYIEGTESIVTFPFPPNLVRDIEVINNEQLISQVSTFIQTNIMYPAHVTILLAENVVFEKDIVNTENNLLDESKKQAEISKFLDTIPFENVSSKVYPLQQGVRIIATNTDLYDAIKKGLEKNGSSIDAVIPSTLLADQSASINGLNNELINTIFANTDSIKTQSLVSPEEEAIKIKQIEAQKNASLSLKGKNGRAIMMSGVLIVLLTIFIALIIMINPFGTYTDKSKSTGTNQPAVTETAKQLAPTNTPVITIVPTADSIQSVKIKIVNASATPALGILLRGKLLEGGFKTVDIANQAGQTVTSTIIVFNQTLPQQTKDSVSNIVKGMFTNFSVQDNANAQADVIITIGNTQ